MSRIFLCACLLLVAGTVAARAQECVRSDDSQQMMNICAGEDYQATSGAVLFVPGAQQQTVGVLLSGDTTIEPNETFALNATIVGTGESATGVGTIINDDVPAVTVSSPSVNEGNSGTTLLPFVVTLTTPAAIPIQAGYATNDVTAKAVEDYQTATGTLTFNPGETVKVVNVTVLGDTVARSSTTTFLRRLRSR